MDGVGGFISSGFGNRILGNWEDGMGEFVLRGKSDKWTASVKEVGRWGDVQWPHGKIPGRLQKR